LEARIALPDLMERLKNLEVERPGSWVSRKALHVHGPASLPVRFTPAKASECVSAEV
jgi:cytochrome P450